MFVTTASKYGLFELVGPYLVRWRDLPLRWKHLWGKFWYSQTLDYRGSGQ